MLVFKVFLHQDNVQIHHSYARFRSVYLGSAVNKNNNVSLEIKRRIVLANRCYFGLSKHFRDKALSRATKIQLYQTLIQPVLLYGAEAWVMSQADETALGVVECYKAIGNKAI